jgi:hypothetical protein
MARLNEESENLGLSIKSFTGTTWLNPTWVLITMNHVTPFGTHCPQRESCPMHRNGYSVKLIRDTTYQKNGKK